MSRGVDASGTAAAGRFRHRSSPIWHRFAQRDTTWRRTGRAEFARSRALPGLVESFGATTDVRPSRPERTKALRARRPGLEVEVRLPTAADRYKMRLIRRQGLLEQFAAPRIDRSVREHRLPWTRR